MFAPAELVDTAVSFAANLLLVTESIFPQCELPTAEVPQIQFIPNVVEIPCGTEANREFAHEVHVNVILLFLEVFLDVPIEVCESSDPRVCMRRRGRVMLRQSLASTTLLSRRRHFVFEELRHSKQRM